jgi:hypothetical protein
MDGWVVIRRKESGKKPSRVVEYVDTFLKDESNGMTDS